MDDTAHEDQPALVIDFGDQGVGRFRAHRYANQFLMADQFELLFTGNSYQQAKAATLLAEDQVLPDEVPRLRAFLMEHGREVEYSQKVYDGLDACWQGETSFPSEPSPDSYTTTTPADGDTSSTDDSSSLDTPATDDGADTEAGQPSGSLSLESPSELL